MTLNDKIELKYNYEILMFLSFLVTMVIISIIALKNISCLEFTNVKIVGMSVLFCSSLEQFQLPSVSRSGTEQKGSIPTLI